MNTEIDDGLKLYSVKVAWSGYSRGFTEYTVRAKNEEEAAELYYEGEEGEREVVRDDTEVEPSETEVILVG